MTLTYPRLSIYLVLLLSVTLAVRGVFINITEEDDTTEVTVLTEKQNDVPAEGTTTATVPLGKSKSPLVNTRSSGDPLKITLWAAVNSKIMTHKERERLLMMGMLKPPLALQKMIVVAHVDPGRNSHKTLKSYEFNAKIDPDD